MHSRLSDSRLANHAAQAVEDGFTGWQAEFGAATCRARQRFLSRDWRGMQRDSTERLDLYGRVVGRVEAAVRRLLPDRVTDPLLWSGMKAVYSGRIDRRDDWELAETFFNSVSRRIFSTAGVDPRVEFVDTDFGRPPTTARDVVYRVFEPGSGTLDLVGRILDARRSEVAYEDRDGQAAQVAARIDERIARDGWPIDRAEVVDAVFYRGQRAYLVGRLHTGPAFVPLVLAFVHDERGVSVDAVLVSEDEVSVLFSFTRSYFFVRTTRPYDLVRFLKTLVPRKRSSELYVSVGYNKHGKTLFYRELLGHLRATAERFQLAEGTPGMVMSVFTMPTFDVVFKLIKDRFPRPKYTSPRAIRAKYDLVFKHDRAGRLVEAQEFEHLELDTRRFTRDLEEQLRVEVADTVRFDGPRVVIEHAYAERRVVPLDVFVRAAPRDEVERAVVDYGQAIKDLAAIDIFPGDLLLKNFGVTRHGRVVFYDYDELVPLSSCTFRRLPPSASFEDELADEPWFGVSEGDIFPEELSRFLGLEGGLRQVFEASHGDLFDVEFWRSTQERLARGELIEILPYSPRCRLTRLG